jgi:hypothetical protein
MNRSKLIGLVALALAFVPVSMLAQDTSGTPKAKAEVRDITGCLAKGDSADEFLLTGKDGSTWEVRSKEVALADHVGHTVTAHGVVEHAKIHNMKEDAKSAAADAGMKKDDTEHGHLTITSVKMVSSSCKK